MAIIILVSFTSFGLGRLSKIRGNKTPITVENLSAGANTAQEKTAKENGSIPKGKMLVGSRSGSKYHFPWCSGALRIKDSNKIWFSSVEEAKKHGYTPAKNCKGLK